MQASERLTLIREELKFSKKIFHNTLDMTSSTYSRYEKAIENGGRHFNSNFLIKLYEKFNISPLWILTGNGNKFIGDVDTISQEVIELIQSAKKIDPETEHTIKSHIINQIFNNIYPMKDLLSFKLKKALFPNNRQAFFFINVLKYIKKNNPTGETYKIILMSSIQSYKLKPLVEFESDRSSLIKVIKNVDETECMHILKNIDISISINKEQIDPLTSVIERARGKLFQVA